jgi:acyl-coenzyme A synthetase/AMP-(fatty) acid ligase
LQDVIEVLDNKKFQLLGRSSDLVDVAGRRASLTDLTQRLLRVPGVLDAVVFQPKESRGLVRRLAALVVAPGRTSAKIRQDFAKTIDPAFIPRPLLIIDQLPRNAAGKLPLAALDRMIKVTQTATSQSE